jgi:hypothetical protein
MSLLISPHCSMHFLKLAEELPTFFSTLHVQEILGIQAESARVLASRYVKKGIFTRLKRDLYVFQKKLLHLSRQDLYELSRLLQPKSYISFSTILEEYKILAPSQLKAPWIEAVNPLRTWERTAGHLTWRYHKLPKGLFFGFSERGNALLATPEKALLDTLYLHSLGRYYLDFKELNLEALDEDQLFRWSQKYPLRTQILLERLFSRSKGGRHP